ncbi:MAG: Wzt carbohydrate-binding domain-containing protein [Candidatus Omnitrophota bacterium]
MDLVKDTKKWAEDISCWNRELGTKEVVINKAEFFNGLGVGCSYIKSGERLRIKVYFTARNRVKDLHFGIAIFREDGVYCYGPNTAFEGSEIPELKKGEGYFLLDCHKVWLAPGEYRISVAIWDKREILAFHYHEGYYKFAVLGVAPTTGELLSIPVEGGSEDGISPQIKKECYEQASAIEDQRDIKTETGEKSEPFLRLLNHSGEEKDVFMTGEPATCLINFIPSLNDPRGSFFWLGIYREDGIYCQGIMRPLDRGTRCEITFPELPLLPGGYRIALGIWDSQAGKFLMFHPAARSFRMVASYQDHGTIYLKHSWDWRLP